MPKDVAKIELYRNDMKFSAAHFTIFNATERERLHGHNYYVRSVIDAELIEPGITYDYSVTRKRIIELCRSLNEYMLLPEHSPYLKISEQGKQYRVEYNQDEMFFLQAETIILPIANVTSEELSRWFVEQLTEDKAFLKEHKIHRIAIQVSTTAGQHASVEWRA